MKNALKKGNIEISGSFIRVGASNIEFATDIRAAILAQNPKGGRIIVWLVFSILVSFIYWASTAQIEEATRGAGRVIPSKQVQRIQNLEGGILAAIFVDVGDTVDKGQVLLEMDKTRFKASYRENRIRYLALLSKIARLNAEIAKTDLVLPKEVANESPEIGERERDLFLSHKKRLAAVLQGLREQHRQRCLELAKTRVHLEELDRSLRLLKRELQLTVPLLKSGAVSEVEILRLRRQITQLEGDIKTSKASIPEIKSSIREAAQAIVQEKLDYVNKANEELSAAYTQLQGISATAIALKDRLKRTSIRSPVRGTVNRILANTIGGVIKPGMDLVELVPLEDSLLVETKIRPSDIGFIHPGQPAIVRFSAYDHTIYGGLDAVLEHIGADTINDETGHRFYRVHVRTKRNYLGSKANPMPIIPGMMATVSITTGKKTIMSYLLKPIVKVKMSALRER